MTSCSAEQGQEVGPPLVVPFLPQVSPIPQGALPFQNSPSPWDQVIKVWPCRESFRFQPNTYLFGPSWCVLWVSEMQSSQHNCYLCVHIEGKLTVTAKVWIIGNTPRWSSWETVGPLPGEVWCEVVALRGTLLKELVEAQSPLFLSYFEAMRWIVLLPWTHFFL